MVLLTASVANPTVRVSVTDIFDQVTKPVVVKATAAPNKSVASNVRAVNGLAYTFLIQDTLRHENYFYPKCKECPGNQQEQHYWSALAELENGKMVQSGVTFGINTDLRGTRTVGYGFKFNGLLNVPQDGLYVFHIQGYDGYCIKLDERDALLWDGLHGPTEQTVALNLAKGNHPLNIGYFVDFPKNGLAGYFKLEWEGPSLERQSIPASALLHVQTATEPQLTLTTKDGNMGAAIIKVKANPNGQTIKKIALYLGRLEIAEATADELVYEGALPTGTGTVWARMFYDEYCTLDSQSTNVSVKNVSLKEWNIGVAGDQTAPYGLTQATPDSLSFFGEGEYVVSKKVKGDFTMTCRVDSYSGKFNEPVNVLSWVGLTAREDASKNNWQWGSEFGVMQTSGYGLRTSAAHVDLGGGRFSEYTLPVNRPWLRIVRQGQMWSAWTSVDGKQWEHGSSHFKPAKEEVDAGVVFRAVREDTHAYYQAKVSQIKLELGVPKEMVLPTPIAAKNTGGERLTGVVVSISEPKVVVVRSSNLGLLRTVDGGQHWTTIGASSSETNCVRSVAIHPNNANIMLRACGNTEDNSLLSLTKDGGKTWQKLDFKGDFDGEGPSALCGEVVSFDPENPTILYAGCETKGFFRSDDEGNTWKMTGIAGERITAVSVSRWVRGDKGQSFLFVCTCPDKWLLCLGRGNPLFPATVLKAHMYASTDGGIGWWPKNERNDLGYFNIAHVKTMPYDAATATSLGV